MTKELERAKKVEQLREFREFSQMQRYAEREENMELNNNYDRDFKREEKVLNRANENEEIKVSSNDIDMDMQCDDFNYEMGLGGAH